MPGRVGADDGDLLAVLGSHLGRGSELGAITQEALELADGHGLGLLTTDALALALVLLRADAAADGGKHGVLADGIESAAEVLRADLLDKAGNVDVDGAASTQNGFLQLRQRSASASAISSVKPLSTGRKSQARSAAGSSLSGVRATSYRQRNDR